MKGTAAYLRELERERPGSVEDMLMRQAHRRRVERFYAVTRDPETPVDLLVEAQIAAYAARKRRAS